MLRQINVTLKIAIIGWLTLDCPYDALSQNLVLNGGFEEYYKCPGSWNYKNGDRRLAPGWSSPTAGTPDLFNVCGSPEAGVPVNFAGKAPAHSGNGYAGIYVWNRGREYREYLSGELKQPLEKGKSYLIEFYFRLARYSRYTTDRIGLMLSETPATSTTDTKLIYGATFTAVYDSAFRRASGLWEKVTTNYNALGGERVITIGNFATNADTRTFYIDFEPVQEQMLASSAYFYVDDVSVIEDVPPPVIIAARDSITPGAVYVLKNISFEYNSYRLLATSHQELDKIANILEQQPEWTVAITGHTDDVGGDDFNLQLSQNRAVSCSRYLMSKGIASSRITFSGKGKSMPLRTGTDDKSRAANRRVEVVFNWN